MRLTKVSISVEKRGEKKNVLGSPMGGDQGFEAIRKLRSKDVGRMLRSPRIKAGRVLESSIVPK